MKVAILAGGMGTRLSEETINRPKPMVEIGGLPILWHIMKLYAYYGFKEFVIALGYRGEVIKDYFVNYRVRSSSLTVNTASGEVLVHNPAGDDWVVHLIDTGTNTNTGGRIRRLIDFIGPETFMLTYGDAVADIDLRVLCDFHTQQGKMATVTAVRPPGRFGAIVVEGSRVSHFAEKPQAAEGWINGGFFVLNSQVRELIADDGVLWEGYPMESLTRSGQLAVFQHNSFWQCLDTPRDLKTLELLWDGAKAPWKIW
jgi:glucose-1-phosphate cytidylyltransferase